MAISRELTGEHSKEGNGDEKYSKEPSQRKKVVVVVGLGMVGIAFM
jgi:hypothetical protein